MRTLRLLSSAVVLAATLVTSHAYAQNTARPGAKPPGALCQVNLLALQAGIKNPQGVPIATAISCGTLGTFASIEDLYTAGYRVVVAQPSANPAVAGGWLVVESFSLTPAAATQPK